ncbi:hypothetical protein PSCICO_50030 [Pseudomonas cichorii]|nr:hypothetical protein PSCICO_50030 [Pseudomonas cichorii]
MHFFDARWGGGWALLGQILISVSYHNKKCRLWHQSGYIAVALLSVNQYFYKEQAKA